MPQTAIKFGGRCDYKKTDGRQCAKRVAAVVGECRYCAARYCIKHRLPETHGCKGLTVCIKKATDLNTSKLLAGRCVGVKI